MKRFLWAAAALLMAVLIPFTAFGEVVSPGEDFWYLDEAGVLSESTEGEIFFANRRLYDACGAEIVIVAVDTAGKLGMEDYTYTLFNEWGIGGESYLGFLLVMAIEDDDYYAMTGTKLDGYLDAGTVQELLDRYLEPDFAKKDYDAGARKFFEAVYAEIADQLNLDLSVKQGIADYEEFVASQEDGSGKRGIRETVVVRERTGLSLGQIVLIILILVVLFSPRRRAVRRSDNGFAKGWILHSLLNSQRSHGPHHFTGPRVPPTGFGGIHRGGVGNGSKSSFGRTSRSSFGGGSRSSGFGGASRRAGGNSRGPSTRGGGAGRGARR